MEKHYLYKNKKTGIVHSAIIATLGSDFTRCGIYVDEVEDIAYLTKANPNKNVTCNNCRRALKLPPLKKKGDSNMRFKFLIIDKDANEVLEEAETEDILLKDIEDNMAAEWGTRTVYIAKIIKRVDRPAAEIKDI